MTTRGTSFQVKRADLRATQTVALTIPTARDLAEGQIVLAIDRFALTANNITYAAFGDAMAYWNFFPATDGWGQIPVWGFADVIASTCDGLAVGERVYGYLPMASHLVVTPGRVKPAGFVDTTEHRQPMAAVYNQYVRLNADPGYTREAEAHQALLRPLFMTSFLIDDQMADNEFYGATQVILSSASSKTSLGTAFCLSQADRQGVEVIGLTSARNAAFVEKTGYYDRVVDYADLTNLDPDVATVFIDMAGDGPLRAKLHTQFSDALKYSCSVGGTHWEEIGGGSGAELPGPRPTLFFAPAQIAKRTKDWGPGGVDARLAAAWAAFQASTDQWLEVIETRGVDNFDAIYRAVLEGRVGAHEGHMVAF